MILKKEIFLNKKKCKNSKTSFASTYNAKILNSFNPELLKDIASEIKSRAFKLLTQLKGFKFMKPLFLCLKNRKWR